MTKYPCSLINFKFAIFDNVVDSFIGQKVLIKHNDNEIIGQVDCCSIVSTKVTLFGDVTGFNTLDTIGIFFDNFIEMPLSPSILGRQLDFFGSPTDDLPHIIPVLKSSNFYLEIQPNLIKNGEIVGKNDWLIKSDNFEIQKGQIKNIESIDQLLPLLEISNLALILVELDYQSKKFINIKDLLKQNELDQVTVFFKSQSHSDLVVSPLTISQTAKYLADQLGFDVLILVSNSELLNQVQSNDFYFAQKLEQLVRFGATNSISLINL